MRLTTFQTVASRYSRTIGRESRVRVTFGGRMAYVRKEQGGGKRLNLPALPPGTVMTTHQADVFRGYLDHEVGHLRWTDLDYVQEQKEFLPVTSVDPGEVGNFKLNKEYDPTLTWIWNVLEDVYEENRTIVDLPGTARFLASVHRFMDGEARKQHAKLESEGYEKTYEDLVLSAIYREAWRHRGVPRDVGHDLELDQLGLDEVRDLIESRLPACESTADCVALAREIKPHLEDASDEFSKKPFDPNSGGGGQEGEEGEEGQGGDGPPGPDFPGSGAPGSGDLDESAERMMSWIIDKALDGIVRDVMGLNARESGKGDGNEVSSTLPGQYKGGGKKDRTCSTTPNVPSEVSLDPENSGSSHRPMEQWDEWLPPVTSEYDQIFVPSSENHDRYRRERAELASHISAAKKNLNTFLRSRTLKAWTRGLVEGDLDDDALADFAALGDRRVYKARRERSIVGSDVALILDLSSSMNAELVRQAGITIAEALADIRRVNLMIAGFYSGHKHLGEAEGCGRNVDLKIPLFKGFDEPYRRIVGRLGAVGTGGCTPLGEGFAYAYEALLERKGPRRVLWIVTDGAPWYSTCSSAGGRHSDYALLEAVSAKARRRGIETMALEIGCSNIAGYVGRAEQINHIDEMTQAIIRLTRRVLVPEIG